MNILFWKKEDNLGDIGEKIAEKFLKKIGYKIIEKNFQNPFGRRLGEIDIIAKDGEEIVFVEVKSRTVFSDFDPLPEENINREKLRRLQKIAAFYVKKNDLWNSQFRFDAVSVIFNKNLKKEKIRHLKNIFI